MHIHIITTTKWIRSRQYKGIQGKIQTCAQAEDDLNTDWSVLGLEL